MSLNKIKQQDATSEQQKNRFKDQLWGLFCLQWKSVHWYKYAFASNFYSKQRKFH